MQHSTSNVITWLKNYVGREMIRSGPTTANIFPQDWSYTDAPVIIMGFTQQGEIICKHPGINALAKVLPLSFTDRNWIPYNNVFDVTHTSFNQWRGKKIKRIRPTSTFGDRKYMSDSDAPILISASKYHMVVDTSQGTTILRSDYMNPEDWILAQ